VRLAGVVLNRVAGEGHYQAVAPPIEEEAGVPVRGSRGRHQELAQPERYHGLVPTTQGPIAEHYFDALATIAASELDLERILKLAETAGSARPHPPTDLFPDRPPRHHARVAIARDRAFSFYYADSLDLLEAWGAELVPFSPIDDVSLPPAVDGVYIGGGFPELFAEELASNAAMRASIRGAVSSGVPLYAECGGYMYAGRSLTDAAGVRHEMTGLLPFESSMSGSRMTLGYREAQALQDGPVAARGTTLRGHEFHWSVSEPPAPEDAAYTVGLDGGGDRLEGSVGGSAWGSYIHLHFAADRRIAPRFVETCATRAASAERHHAR
jgi:cobyrinic acid a,c-diamide synthase